MRLSRRAILRIVSPMLVMLCAATLNAQYWKQTLTLEDLESFGLHLPKGMSSLREFGAYQSATYHQTRQITVIWDSMNGVREPVPPNVADAHRNPGTFSLLKLSDVLPTWLGNLRTEYQWHVIWVVGRTATGEIRSLKAEHDPRNPLPCGEPPTGPEHPSPRLPSNCNYIPPYVEASFYLADDPAIAQVEFFRWPNYEEKAEGLIYLGSLDLPPYSRYSSR